VLLKSVYTSSSSSDLYVYDLLEYVKHKDDKMRTTTCLLMGQFIQSVLVENDGDYDSWLLATVDKYRLMEKESDAAARCVQRLRLDSLVDALLRFIRSDNAKFTSNICKRFAVMALRCFLPTLVRTRHSSYALEILVNLLHLRHSTYNLVKCELIDLMASIDFKCVLYAEQIISRGEKRYKS
jgi:huntingtin